MAPSLVHLPNGQTLTVSPVFGGMFFKATDLNLHQSVFPPGWTIILNSEDDEDDHASSQLRASQHGTEGSADADDASALPKKHHVHPFRQPSLRNDHLYISSISNPASSDFRPSTSPSRQIAMMLWATLCWYFHQPEPTIQLTTAASAETPDAGKPKGEWRVNINREGILRGKHLLPKLERMGLIASEDSTVGVDPEDGVTTSGHGWSQMFVSRRTFWQLDPRIYLFTLTPVHPNSPYPSLSPSNSRPASPNRNSNSHILALARSDDSTASPGVGGSLQPRSITPPGPFTSNAHLPTFYPPPPPQYTFTNNVRHPIRPKPPRQGETFYTRYVPSLGQHISFRVASLSKKPCPQSHPISFTGADTTLRSANTPSPSTNPSASATSTQDSSSFRNLHLTDTEILHKWMNDPRVAHSWGEQGPASHQEAFLKHNMTSKHSFPVIGCFDGRPFAYFELYWVKEDRLASHLSGECGDWDRGLHVLVGEQEFRGPHRIKVWLSALLHYCWLADARTNVVMMEPRVDNLKLKQYCEEAGFYKEREVSFPHKQSNLMKIRREAWESPAL